MSPQRALPETLRAVLRRLPTGPGVYLMKSAAGRVLYVGKADALRSRVRSYFGERPPEDVRISRMVTEIADVDYIVTDTVSEAYLLESNLIKEHRPRFNIRLRDDKSYPFVKITLGEDFPRIVRTRRLVRDGSRYFGPYASASSVDETLKLLRKIFPFRTCNLDIPEGKRVLDRPCLLYYIKRCQGPCIQAIEKQDYRETIGQIVDFLDGRQEPIAADLKREMESHSEALRFEQAAATRDKLRAVERTMEQQKMAAFSRAEHDVIGLAPAEDEDLATYLADRRGVRVTITVPERGEKRRLVALATQNAVEALERERAEWMADAAKRDEALTELASALGLPRVPERIECYDMSNIQGTSAVGSMVVFIDGRPEPREYRRFRIRSGDTPDDFRMMAEVLRRRFSRIAKLRSETGALSLAAVGADEAPEDAETEEGQPPRDQGWAVPDLVI